MTDRLIDPPVGAYSELSALLDWQRTLRVQFPDSDERLRALRQVALWIHEARRIADPRQPDSGTD